MITKHLLCVLVMLGALVTVCGVCTGEPVFYTEETKSADILDSGLELLSAVLQEYGIPHVPHYLLYQGGLYDDASIFEKDFKKDRGSFLDQKGTQWWIIDKINAVESVKREPGNTYLSIWQKNERFALEYKPIHTPVPTIAPAARPTSRLPTNSLLAKYPASSLPCGCAGGR